MKRSWVLALIPVATVLIILIGIELLVRWRDVSPLVLPAPSEVFNNVATHAGGYASDAVVTLKEAALGFGIAMVGSIVLAAVMVLSPWVARVVEPLSAAVRVTPIVAIAPALALWLGFGALPKIVVAALITFPPFLINAYAGFRSVDRASFEVLRSLHASAWEVFRVLRVPSALPYLFSAARLSVSLGLIGAVVAEWAGSAEGLGYRIVRAQSDLQTTTVWAAIAVLVLLSMSLTALVSLIERWCLRWREAAFESGEE